LPFHELWAIVAAMIAFLLTGILLCLCPLLRRA
jgi:hypothetical protein